VAHPVEKPDEETVMVSLGAARGDGTTALEVISMNGRTRARLASIGGGLNIWRTMSGQLPRRLFAGLGQVTALALDSTGHRLAAGDASGRVRVWNWESDRQAFYRADFPRPVERLAFFGDGPDRLVVGWRATPGQAELRPKVIDFDGR
jgi:WD40 repeat protein